MSEPSSEKRRADNEASGLLPGVEPDQVNVGLLAAVGAFMAVVVLLVVVLLQAWFYDWRGSLTRSRAVPSDSLETALGRALVEQREPIRSYHWVNREAGIRAIPIERARELVAREMAAAALKAPKDPAKK
jgi:hypothetical protein